MPPSEHELTPSPRRPVRSLAWCGDDLVDFAAGGVRWHLDGSVADARWVPTFRFDAASVSPSGRFAVLNERRGTKAAVLDVRSTAVLRELDRSFHMANGFDNPISFVAIADGTEAIVHCPERFDGLEIDDAATGRRLTSSARRNASDVFHSRLVQSPGGAHLLSVGWIWHPFGVVCVFSLAAALRDPAHLDSEPVLGGPDASVDSATWLDDGAALAVSVGTRLVTLDAETGASRAEAALAAPTGQLYRLPGRGLLATFEHPRLLDPATGSVLREWPGLPTGTHRGPLPPNGVPPPFAVHPTRPWFAVANGDRVTVVRVDD